MRKHCSPAFLLLCLASAFPTFAADDNGCDRMIWANVIALDQPFLVNRLGAAMPEGMVYALERDVVSKTCAGGNPCSDPLVQGNVMLRTGKRPRPIVLRANVGDCLGIRFRNLLAKNPVSTQPATRFASVHVAGMEMVGSIDSDGSLVASNNNSTVAPGGSITYVLRATAEGTFLLNSEGAAFGGTNQPNDGAQVTAGLFGAVNVQPKGSEWYRSQVTHADLEMAVDTSKSGGFSSLGQPFLNYKAVYPPGNPNAGLPILAMLDSKNNLIYTDLTAVITGPNAGKFPNAPPCDPNLGCINIEPNRLDPYREFTIQYHELMDTVQAFPIFGESKPEDMATTLGAGGDAFAINYGSGGIGAEILANRFGLGPMGSCADCRFEEFFLSAWTSGDAAMLVDIPANLPCANQTNQPAVTKKAAPGDPTNIQCTPGVKGNAPAGITPYRKATKALYDDDPSNVYHSYINDRVKFRILHTGTGVSHVHHLHAHQWVHSPNSDGSTYLDSQLINPGSAYTLEITFNGGGNRNKVVGDSIFHCHFYPHFAAGMWAMWRSHDVFEVGSPFQSTKFPQQMNKYKGRALPDGEIAAGTPIPALIPMPTLMMAPMPSEVNIVPVKDPNGGTPPVGYQAVVAPAEQNVNPGFPFFIPGIAGTRAPHPPLDFAVYKGVPQDGGLPRHLLINAKITTEEHNTLDFTKDYKQVNAFELPENGTPVELTAQQFHSKCFHASFTPEGTASGANDGFRTNGLPAISGAPYADPGLVPYDENSPPANPCLPISNWINYKAAVIQVDLVLNKKAWHYPQSRLLTLWRDVLPTYRSEVAQEPFFIRANARQGVEYWHTNLVPSYYKVDDYQVNTPTDIIGQHIHLVKFDVTSSDGAANGYNYEDGTLSYQEVQELVTHVNQCGGLASSLSTLTQCGTNTNRTTLTLKAPPDAICPASEIGKAPCSGWKGAQTTVQRWFADPIDQTPCTPQQSGNCTFPQADNTNNGTRTLRTVFTHDHFGPSTHQQTGLYAALLVEPENSSWFQSETGTPLRTRDDGGPTTWNAVIVTPGSEENTYREFALAMQDFQFAYKNTSKTSTDPIGSSTPGWSDPANVIEAPFGNVNKLQPQIISAGPTSGVTSFNYRNEPLGLRVSGSGGDPKATDLAYVFSSTITRNDGDLNKQPTPGAFINPAAPNAAFIFPKKPLTFGMQPKDPYTPLLRAYEGDRIQIRLIAGAHMLPHAFTVGGMKWLFEPSFGDSGHRSTQSIGISEHFEMLFRTPRASPSKTANANWADYLYMPDASNQKHGLIDGTWGIFRAYQSKTDNLMPLTAGQIPTPLPDPPASQVAGYSCPPNAPMKPFRIQSRTPATLTFNSRGTGPKDRFNGTQITNFFPLMYALEDNINTTEPLFLRANAGDCIALTLANKFNPNSGTFLQTSNPAYDSSISLSPSKYAGLTPALLSFDAMKSTGLNVGFNPDQIVAAGAERTYYWYAGQTTVAQNGTITGVPIELGSVNLTPADPLEQDLHGLVAGMVIEPAGSIACVDTYNGQSGLKQYGSATIYAGGTCANPGKLLYREFLLLTQDDLANVEWFGGSWSLAGTTFNAPGGSTQVAVNYRTEPMPYRFADSKNNFVKRPDLWQAYWNGLVLAEPQTPIFAAAKGTPTRFRLLHPAGSGNQQVLALHGHVWQELPYTATSTSIGNNPLSQYLGARDNYGTNMAYEIDLPSAGGIRPVGGDYLWRTTPANYLEQGLWGVFRVFDGGSDAVRIAAAQFSQGTLTVSGSTTVFVDSTANPKNGQRAATVSLFLGNAGQQGTLLSNSVPVTENGIWYFTSRPPAGSVGNQPMQITAVSPNGGRASFPLELVVVPAMPMATAPDADPNAVSEIGRFNALPRSHGEKNPQPEGDEIPASLNAPPSVDSPAPPTSITPPKPPDE